jgi:hypothetical protein
LRRVSERARFPAVPAFGGLAPARRGPAAPEQPVRALFKEHIPAQEYPDWPADWWMPLPEGVKNELIADLGGPTE